MNGRQFMYIPPQFEDDEAPADQMYSPRRQYHMPHRVFEDDEAPADLMYSPRRQYMPRVFEHDEAHADRMYSPRPQRLRTSRQEAARQRRRTQRAVRRAKCENPDNIFLNAPPDNPRNIFLNPIQRMPRPAVGPRRQSPNPASKRSLRKASRQRRAERARMIADGWVFGGKTRRHRRY